MTKTVMTYVRTISMTKPPFYYMIIDQSIHIHLNDNLHFLNIRVIIILII